MEHFDALWTPTIGSTLGLRYTQYGYQWSEILRSLMCVYLCGGSCVENVTTHFMKHLSLHPFFLTCTADTMLRAIKELTYRNDTYEAASGKSLNFNTADKMNDLLVNALKQEDKFLLPLSSGFPHNHIEDYQLLYTFINN